MDISLARGRAFTELDTAESTPVAIVNEALAKRLWPNEDPIGKAFSVQSSAGPFIQVVEVTPTGKYLSPTEDSTPFYYLPQKQSCTSLRVLHIRTTAAPGPLLTSCKQEFRALSPDLPIFDARPLRDAIDESYVFSILRIGARLTGILGCVGLVLAMLGIYGAISYACNQRISEFGIRMALGAKPAKIFEIVIKQGVAFIGTGLFTGLLITLVVGDATARVLPDVSGHYAVILGFAAGFVATIGIAACVIPAWRATTINPIIARKARIEPRALLVD
jgi:hypothetical protein